MGQLNIDALQRPKAEAIGRAAPKAPVTDGATPAIDGVSAGLRDALASSRQSPARNELDAGIPPRAGVDDRPASVNDAMS